MPATSRKINQANARRRSMTDVGYLSRAFTRRRGAHLRSENKHDYRYYVLDAPIISDAEYDELKRRTSTEKTCLFVGDPKYNGTSLE